MTSFKRLAFFRIATVTVTLSALATPVAWYVSRENAEEQVVAFAQEDARRVLAHSQAIDLQGPNGELHAGRAAKALVGGLFEIAEIYNAAGLKLSEEMTPTGHELERLLPKHGVPAYAKPFYESLRIDQGRWVMRVMVPLQPAAGGAITGYFEGVRLVPAW
ncbi:MAG: metal-dependent phosphohydrolase, partial [Burkholderiales bacterium]|nr:metal-dependent phosphohydrolase [Burkholderiales bacterium]